MVKQVTPFLFFQSVETPHCPLPGGLHHGISPGQGIHRENVTTALLILEKWNAKILAIFESFVYRIAAN